MAEELRPEIPIKHELEKRFLVAKMPEDYKSYPNRLLRTGYLSIGGDGEDRIRQDGDKYERVTKLGKGMSKEEHPTPLTEEEFWALWPQIVVGKEETRYDIPVEGGTAEIKMMHGRDEGRGEVEVEFDSEEGANHFVPPGWFGREVTNDEGYTSKSLAQKGYPEEAKLPIGEEK